MVRLVSISICLLALSGCRSTNGDRLPATAADNPDPIFGGNAKLRQPPSGEQPSGNVSVPANTATGTPTSQRSGSGDRIGPLSVQPRNPAPTDAAVGAGVAPGTANLTTGVRPPVEPMHDQQVKPAANNVPTSNPDVVQDYRTRMNRFGVAGLRTKALDNGTWEAVGHFPVTGKTNELRRIEAHGATEADALLAILEQLEKPQ